MKVVSNRWVKWLMTRTLLLRCFVIALLLHLAMLLVLGSVRVVAVLPKIIAAFEGAPPPVQEATDPFAAYRDVDYRAAGASALATPGGYRVVIAPPTAPAANARLTSVIGVTADSAASAFRLNGSFVATTPPSFDIGDRGKLGLQAIAGPIPGAFAGRLGAARAKTLAEFPGTEKTEKALLAALQWLKSNQRPDGTWDSRTSKTRSTALAMLAFLGHGETTDSAEFGVTVQRGLKYLIGSIGADGLVKETGASPMYTQGVVTLALAEAYGLTQARALRESLERAVKAIVDAQKVIKTKPEDAGGWRNTAKSRDADTTTSSWLIMALKTAQNAGVSVPPTAFEMATKYLWNMYDEDGGFGYQGPTRIPDTTGAAVFCLQAMGRGDDPRLKKALDYLKQQKVEWDKTDGDYVLHSWYQITLAMFHAGGSSWEYWHRPMRDTLLKEQADDGHWDKPKRSRKDGENGLAYSTALSCMILEVYYRYPPLYQEGGKRGGALAPR